MDGSQIRLEDVLERRGDHLAIFLSVIVVVMWVTLVPGLLWAVDQYGLTSLSLGPDFEPMATVSEQAFLVPAFLALLLGLAISLGWITESRMIGSLGRLRRPVNPLGHSEAVLFAQYLASSRTTRTRSGDQAILANLARSRLLFGAPVTAIPVPIIPVLLLVALLGVAFGPPYIVSIFTDALAAGVSWGLWLFVLMQMYVVGWMAALLASSALMISSRFQWRFDRTWAAILFVIGIIQMLPSLLNP